MWSELHLSEDHPGLAIFYCFKVHLTEAVSKLLEDNNIHLVIVPANCTDRLQPLDLSLNKPVKEFLCKKIEIWFSEQILSRENNLCFLNIGCTSSLGFITSICHLR